MHVYSHTHTKQADMYICAHAFLHACVHTDTHHTHRTNTHACMHTQVDRKGKWMDNAPFEGCVVVQDLAGVVPVARGLWKGRPPA